VALAELPLQAWMCTAKYRAVADEALTDKARSNVFNVPSRSRPKWAITTAPIASAAASSTLLAVVA
jgi:hypothetical protein